MKKKTLKELKQDKVPIKRPKELYHDNMTWVPKRDYTHVVKILNEYALGTLEAKSNMGYTINKLIEANETLVKHRNDARAEVAPLRLMAESYRAKLLKHGIDPN